MKLKNLNIATLILILIGLGFSSCEPNRDHYYWAKAQLVSDLELYSDNKGFFDTYYDLDINRNIVDLRGRHFFEVTDVKYFSGDIELTSNNDFFESRLCLMERDKVISEYYFGNGRAGKHVYAGRDVELFQADIAEYIRRNGYAKLLFEGESDFNNSRLNVSILMDIDAYVRD